MPSLVHGRLPSTAESNALVGRSTGQITNGGFQKL